MSLLQEIHDDYIYMLKHDIINPATVEKFLKLHKEYLLSDIIYNLDVYNKFAAFAGIPAAVRDPDKITF